MIGTRVLHYDILEKLGEGGMGVVYKAHDTKLDRFVALKFLPQNSAATEIDRARFLQEARAAAALNHPNVCSVIDIAEHEGTLFLVMEFVDGVTLRQKAGSLTFKQTIDVSIQLADGLAAAHEKGIVHRDIKPENIMIRKDGIAQIMDFGLAKLRSASSRINRLTKEGSTVGTAGYMSPEQVQGQDADHRSDIFSFGVVLYELLTGQLPFKGVHETALMYEIVNVDPPPMIAVKPDLDPSLDAVVLECLAKDPGERFQSIAEVAKELRRAKRESTKQRVSRITAARPVMQSTPSVAVPAQQLEPERQPEQRSGSPVWKWLAIVALAGCVALGAFVVMKAVEHQPVLRAELIPPPSTSYSMANGGGHLALSPDGRMIAFSAVDTGGKTNLWVRSMTTSSARALAGTEGAQYPFWSPDSRTIAFFASGKLLKVDVGGGTPFTIAEAPSSRGGTWNSDGIIVFAPDQSKGLFKVPASGGTPVELTKLDTTMKELTHRWPVFLPDNDHYLFFARGSLGGFGGPERDHLCLGALSKPEIRRVLPAISDALYADGMVLYVRETSIVGQKLNIESGTVTGDPITIVQDIQYTPRWSKGSFTISANGVLAYQPGGQESRSDVILVDKDGTVLHHIGRLDLMFKISISPDKKRLAMDLLDAQSRNIDIWIYDIERGVKTRLTFAKEADLSPIWSPKGDRIAYTKGLGGETALMTQSISGSGQEEKIMSATNDFFVSDWSHDEAYILFHTRGQSDVWVVPTQGARKPSPVLQSEYGEMNAHFSPDVRWIAYQSDESGRSEVYVRTFTPPGASGSDASIIKRQISIDGGGGPVWRSDGNAVFYQTPRGVMLAELRIQGGSLEIVRVVPFSRQRSAYFGDVHASGSMIATQVTPVASAVVPINIIVNWPQDIAGSLTK